MKLFVATESQPEAGLWRQVSFATFRAPALATAVVSLVALYFIGLYSFLLFHVLIEIFSVIVAFAIFMFAWNTRAKINNSTLLLLGAAYLVIGAVDLLHAITYKGMGVFDHNSADTATQLWIAARYLESGTLAAAPLLITRRIRLPRALALYGVLFILVVAAIFVWPLFPTCYIEGVGLTAFKKISEYIIAAILLIGLAGLTRRRRHFDDTVFRLLAASMVLTIVAELMFTFYISVYGISNLVGHYFKLGSFWLIYKAIIETGLQQPYNLLFRELAQSEKRYRDLVDTLPTGILEIDPDLRITYSNPAGLQIIGYTAEDVWGGIHLDQLLDAKGNEKARRLLDDMRGGRATGSAGYRLLRKDGGRAEVLVNTIPVYDGERLRAIQTTLTDVTELNRLQHSLQQAKKMEAVGMLAGGMAHEINNVLMGVAGRLELLKFSAAQGKAVAPNVNQALVSCERISQLIKKLLAYSRGGRYRSQLIEMAEFIDAALAALRDELSPKIRLTHDFSPGLPRIAADPDQLRMVVAGIINNAAEAIDDAGRIEVDLASRNMDAVQSHQRPGMQPGYYVRLKVRDTGKGMDAETLQHIFEPFYTKKFQGRGLGMAAVYGIVKNHGGWIGVDSQPGRGTTVRIYFPVFNGSADSKACRTTKASPAPPRPSAQ